MYLNPELVDQGVSLGTIIAPKGICKIRKIFKYNTST